jgi:hypothetical protein
MDVQEHALEDVLRSTPGHWFLSNPSARDGNILPEALIPSLCDRGDKVVLDLAYAGSTRPYEFDLRHPNIIATVLSASKPYGVFRFRAGGFTLSRDEIPSLYGNKWFKDITRLFDALVLAERLPPGTLAERYQPLQAGIVELLRAETGIPFLASDALLLAHLPLEAPTALSDGQQSLIAPFRRGSGYRFCLTPYFEHAERERGESHD